MQPKEAGIGGGESREDSVAKQANEMLSKLPPAYDQFEVKNRFVVKKKLIIKKIKRKKIFKILKKDFFYFVSDCKLWAQQVR